MRKIIVKILRYFGLYERVEVIKYKRPSETFKIGDEVVVNYSTGGQAGTITSKEFFDDRYGRHLVLLKESNKETSAPSWLLSKIER